ncbi:MAG: glyoxalase, partial [Nitratireductor sp.]
MIKVTDIAYVRFRAPDLDEMETFLLEFGLVRAERRADKLFMRGTDPLSFAHVTELGEPGFAGLGFYAESVADLEKVAAAHGLPVEESDAPGAGKIVRFTDPNGFPVDIVAGQSAPHALPVKRRLVHNDGDERPRRGDPLRVEPGPSQVKRLGHCVINVKDFRETEAWYKERFGLVTSDEIEIAPGAP